MGQLRFATYLECAQVKLRASKSSEILNKHLPINASPQRDHYKSCKSRQIKQLFKKDGNLALSMKQWRYSSVFLKQSVNEINAQVDVERKSHALYFLISFSEKIYISYIVESVMIQHTWQI